MTACSDSITHVGDIHSNITHQNNTQARLLQLICRTLLANSIKPTLEVETTLNVDFPGNILECHWVKQTAEQEISHTDKSRTSRSHSQSDIALSNQATTTILSVKSPHYHSEQLTRFILYLYSGRESLDSEWIDSLSANEVGELNWRLCTGTATAAEQPPGAWRWLRVEFSYHTWLSQHIVWLKCFS